MILVLFGLASADLLCYGTASAAMNANCTDHKITDGTTAFPDLSKTYEIYTKTALTLSPENFKTVTKIFNDDSTSVKVTVSDVKPETRNFLELEKIELGLEGSGALFTIKHLKLDELSSMKPGNGFTLKIEKLECESDSQIVEAQLLPTSEVILTCEQMAAINYAGETVNIGGATIKDGMAARILVKAKKGATLIYTKSKTSKLLSNTVPITVQSIGDGQTITFAEDYDVDNSHWKVDATVPTSLSLDNLEDARKVCLPESQHLFTIKNGARVKLEKYFDSYCIGEATTVDVCKEKSLKATEYGLPFYMTDKPNVTLVAYGSSALPVTLSDLKGSDSIIMSSDSTKEKIEMAVKAIENHTENAFTSNGIELTFKATSLSEVNFGKVKFFNSTVKSDEDTGNKPFVSIIGDEITSDISSLGGLKSLIKKQMSGGVIEEKDVSKVSVSSDGKKMKVSKNSEEGEIEDDLFKGSLTLKVSGGSKESEDKRIPFEIETTTTLKKMAEGSKTFDFSLEMPSGLSLYPVFVGDWSGYTIEVRGGDDFVYDSVTKAGSKGPKIENKSNKPIIVDGQEIVSKKDNDKQNKSGLSAGGIAGIVIACVVVVAAVGVTVFFVIKKKSKFNTF